MVQRRKWKGMKYHLSVEGQKESYLSQQHLFPCRVHGEEMIPIEKQTYYGLPSWDDSGISIEDQARFMFPNAGLPTWGGGCVVKPQLEPVLSSVCMSCKKEASDWMEREGPRWFERKRTSTPGV